MDLVLSLGEHLSVNLLVALLLPFAGWRYLEAVRNPRRRVWREDRCTRRALRSMGTIDVRRRL